MEANEIWAYRETGKHPLVPVRFLRHRRNTNKNNTHAQIRFEDPDADDLETWVPTGRLKCLWTETDEFIAKERRWADARLASTVGVAIDRAVGTTLDLLDSGMIEGMGGGEQGSLTVSPFKIPDVKALSKLSGIPEAELTSAPTTFEEDGGHIVPFKLAN